MYLIKLNNKTVLPDDLAQALLLDFISGVIAAYIVMLHRNPTEFQTGGLVVNLYRLVFFFFLESEKSKSKKSNYLLHEIFYNEFPECKVKDDELESVFVRLVALFQTIGDKAGLSTEEFVALITPVDPNSSEDVRSWWREEL